MTNINPVHLEALVDLINQGPYFQLLSMRLEKIGLGTARMTVELSQKLLNPFGGIHGGVYSALLETAAYWAVYAELEEDAGLTAIDLQKNNLGHVNTGRLIAEGRRIKIGQTICLAESVITNERGKILAHGTAKLLVTKGLQTIEQLARNKAILPPKFL